MKFSELLESRSHCKYLRNQLGCCCGSCGSGISKFQNLYYKTLHNGYIFNEYDGNEDYFNNILTLRDNTIDTLEYSYNTTEYKNISAVFNTKYTPAEKISSKIHRDSFGIAGNSMGEISPEFFKNKISRSFRKIKSKRFDVILMNPVKPNKVVKLINETLYTEYTIKEIKDTFHIHTSSLT